MSVAVKICGLTDAVAVQAAIDHGAAFVGFVFYPASPRHVNYAHAAQLAALVPATVTKVGLFVDPSDDQLRECLGQVPLDMIQLHGTETPARVTAIRAQTGRRVMKALRIGGPEDLFALPAFEPVADWLLFDTKTNSALPGGTGQSFDWTVLRGLKVSKPWMLAGGLHVGNMAEATRVTNASCLDVSSGVEDAPGQKSVAKITALLKLAASL
jgi:phosphoribosylanthranilate isomerase